MGVFYCLIKTYFPDFSSVTKEVLYSSLALRRKFPKVFEVGFDIKLCSVCFCNISFEESKLVTISSLVSSVVNCSYLQNILKDYH